MWFTSQTPMRLTITTGRLRGERTRQLRNWQPDRTAAGLWLCQLDITPNWLWTEKSSTRTPGSRPSTQLEILFGTCDSWTVYQPSFRSTHETKQPYYFPPAKFTLVVSTEGAATFAFKIVWAPSEYFLQNRAAEQCAFQFLPRPVRITELDRSFISWMQQIQSTMTCTAPPTNCLFLCSQRTSTTVTPSEVFLCSMETGATRHTSPSRSTFICFGTPSCVQLGIDLQNRSTVHRRWRRNHSCQCRSQ